MDESVKVILKKLDDIDARIKNLEVSAVDVLKPADVVNVAKVKVDRDPLFSKALEVMDKYDEMSSKQLSDALKIDVKRAETIMDQMEAAGIGTCYMKEA
jgi:DNA segregation ATPase FtsK/SpoIIIE-like protein